jgi:Zn-finger in Ran binding protein and others
MTNERQAEFRGKLFSMLGDRGQVQASASSSSSKDKEGSLRTKEGSDRDHSTGSDGLRVSIANARTSSTESGTGSEGSSGVGRDRVQSPLGGQYAERGVEGDGWICPSCTLTNSTVSRRCTTCEAVRSN